MSLFQGNPPHLGFHCIVSQSIGICSLTGLLKKLQSTLSLVKRQDEASLGSMKAKSALVVALSRKMVIDAWGSDSGGPRASCSAQWLGMLGIATLPQAVLRCQESCRETYQNGYQRPAGFQLQHDAQSIRVCIILGIPAIYLLWTEFPSVVRFMNFFKKIKYVIHVVQRGFPREIPSQCLLICLPLFSVQCFRTSTRDIIFL